MTAASGGAEAIPPLEGYGRIDLTSAAHRLRRSVVEVPVGGSRLANRRDRNQARQHPQRRQTCTMCRASRVAECCSETLRSFVLKQYPAGDPLHPHVREADEGTADAALLLTCSITTTTTNDTMAAGLIRPRCARCCALPGPTCRLPRRPPRQQRPSSGPRVDLPAHARVT
jgi:hypothetical protein